MKRFIEEKLLVSGFRTKVVLGANDFNIGNLVSIQNERWTYKRLLSFKCNVNDGKQNLKVNYF